MQALVSLPSAVPDLSIAYHFRWRILSILYAGLAYQEKGGIMVTKSRGAVKSGMKHKLRERTCIDCGETRLVHSKAERCYPCSTKRRIGKYKHDKATHWKGGKWDTGDGYIRMLIPEDSPFIAMADKGRRVLEHRLAMAQKLGRCLMQNEHVHHINGNRSDNHPDNLQLMSQADHNTYQELCRSCNLRKEIRLLIVQNKMLLEQVRELNLRFMEGGIKSDSSRS